MQKVFPMPINRCYECPYFYVNEETNKGRCSPLVSANDSEIEIDIDPCIIHPECPLDNYKFDEKGNIIISLHSEQALWEREQQKKE